MPPTAFHESQRTYEQIEKAAKDTLDKICEFDIKLCPWETLLNKYCVLNKNLETIQSLIKKDDSNFRMALLYPKDENVDNLVRITNILSVYTNDLQKTKETKELPQITSNNQLAYSLLNPSEQIEKRSNHDDIISSCSAYIKENWKFTGTIPMPNGNKKANTQQRPYSKFGECKDLLTADQQKYDASIRKQAKMRNNTLLLSMQKGFRVMNEDKTDIAHLKDAEKKSLAILHVSKKPERKEEPFKVNLPVLTANNNPPTIVPQPPPPTGKIKISTVHNPNIPVKKEVETPGQESKRTAQKKTTPVTNRQTVKKSPSITAPSPTVKTPSPSTTANNPSFIPPQGVTPPITPQTPTAAAARARQTPQSATNTPKNIQSRPPAMAVNNMGTTASPTPGSNGRPQASPNANLQNQLFNMQQQMLRAGTPGSFPISPMVFRPQMNVANMPRGTTPPGYPNVRFTGNPTQFAGPPYFQLLAQQAGQQQPQQQQPPQQQKK